MKKRARAHWLALLNGNRALTPGEQRLVANQCRAMLEKYRRQIARRSLLTRRTTALAHKAYLFLGGDPDPPSFSLRQYDHKRYGPFLGVSDEGSAVAAIREAACASPKCIAF